MERRFVLKILFSIVIVGLTLRIGFLLINIDNFRLYGDAKNYILMSHQLVENGIYGYSADGKSGSPNAFVTPGYPLFLSVVYSIFRDPYTQITIVRILQAVIGSASALLAFLAVYRIFRRNDVALLTAFFVAFYPTYIESTVFILTEVTALATMLLYFYLATAGLQDNKGYLNVIAGLAFAIHILVRPALLPLFVIPFIYAYFKHYRTRRHELLIRFIQSALGFIVVMLPWWIRNYTVLDSIIITATGSGHPLLGGTYPFLTNIFWDASDEVMGSTALQIAYAKKRIINGFLTQPILYLKWYTAGKVYEMFSKPWLYDHMLFANPWRYIHLPFVNIFYVVFHGLFMSLGIIGVFLNSYVDKINRMIGVYLFLFLSLYLFFIPANRYAYQLMFFLMVEAAFLICNITGKLRRYLRQV
ncbi:MAG: glycosyltransferase family 39 protein [Clostridia bacterium]|nr:glycosyltransferase family 39 protein [Clostridia bacterium]